MGGYALSLFLCLCLWEAILNDHLCRRPSPVEVVPSPDRWVWPGWGSCWEWANDPTSNQYSSMACSFPESPQRWTVSFKSKLKHNFSLPQLLLVMMFITKGNQTRHLPLLGRFLMTLLWTRFCHFIHNDYCSLGASGSPAHKLENPSVLFSPIPLVLRKLWTKEWHLRSWPRTELLTIPGHHPSTWLAHHQPLPKVYKTSPLWLRGTTSLALFSETSESSLELLCCQ